MYWTTDDLLPNIIRRLRQRTRPFASVVAPDGVLEHISLQDLHNASNRAAWFLRRNLGRNEEKFLYMGPNDIRYSIWILGAMKSGKCVSTLSETYLHMNNCSIIASILVRK